MVGQRGDVVPALPAAAASSLECKLSGEGSIFVEIRTANGAANELRGRDMAFKSRSLPLEQNQFDH